MLKRIFENCGDMNNTMLIYSQHKNKILLATYKINVKKIKYCLLTILHFSLP